MYRISPKKVDIILCSACRTAVSSALDSHSQPVMDGAEHTAQSGSISARDTCVGAIVNEGAVYNIGKVSGFGLEKGIQVGSGRAVELEIDAESKAQSSCTVPKAKGDIRNVPKQREGEEERSAHLGRNKSSVRSASTAYMPAKRLVVPVWACRQDNME
jgi:hypothetical protein